MSTGHRLIEVVVDGHRLVFLCSEDMSACGSRDDAPREILIKAIEALYGKRLRVFRESRGDGIEVVTLREE